MFSPDYLDSKKLNFEVSSVNGIGDPYFPRLKVELRVQYNSPGNTITTPGAKAQEWHLSLIEHRLNLTVEGAVVATSGTHYDRVEPYMVTKEIYDLPISRAALQFIESRRKDDVTLFWSLGGICLESDRVSVGKASQFNISYPMPLSQAKWTNLLSELGFSETWIVEISKPKISDSKAMNEAKRFLSEADAELLTGSPDDVVSKCRKALDALKSAYSEEQWKKVNEQIDFESPGQPGKLPKSDKFGKLLEGVREWSHIGPHADKYRVTFDDARLCFQQTLSLVAYVSQVAKKMSD